jgi:hypothetical protein
MTSLEGTDDTQRAAWRQREDGISRNGQGISNYGLGQTTIQDDKM